MSPSASDSAAPVIRRLGLRLGHLYQWALAAGPFNDIWDLCCDHGKLGLHLHQTLREQAPATRSRVHLVDQAPQSIFDLQAKYGSLLDGYLTMTCMDAAEITLSFPGRQMVVVAGVGGGTVVSILAELKRQLAVAASTLSETEFLLSPNLNTFELRRFLHTNDFELVNEAFVVEKGWCHEHLHIRYRPSVSPHLRVTIVGSSLWNPMTPEKKRYLKKQLDHYQKRAQLSGHTESQLAVDAYRGLLQLH